MAGFFSSIKLQFAIHQAELLRRQYAADQDWQALDQAIEQFEGVLRHPDFPSMPSDQVAGVLNMSAQSLRARYNWRGQRRDLEQALELWHEALKLSERIQNRGYQASFLNNLSMGLNARYLITGDRADLDQAVQMAKQSVELTDRHSDDYSKHLNGLARDI
jgi:tetratricopeptide (TPR) repeat protein